MSISTTVPARLRLLPPGPGAVRDPPADGGGVQAAAGGALAAIQVQEKRNTILQQKYK